MPLSTALNPLYNGLVKKEAKSQSLVKSPHKDADDTSP
jgi:hypothetical protein